MQRYRGVQTQVCGSTPLIPLCDIQRGRDKYKIKGLITFSSNLKVDLVDIEIKCCYRVLYLINTGMKGTVSVISSDPPCKGGNSWFTTVPK